ncbi:MAG: ubiquinol oxidase subunit II [Alphaproteobacteria bacterium]
MKKTSFAILTLLSTLLLVGCKTDGVIDPKGPISSAQLNLMIFAAGVMLLVIIPVILMGIFFAFRYREGNKNAEYRPDFTHSNKIELVCWGIPILIIITLAIITYRTSHSLDPYRPLESDKDPVTIQVVSLDWKWLFIYPEQGIATVNTITIPEDTPINFEITSDAVMNSFWIPDLAGQIYAMAGMKTKLHLMADEPGVYDGKSTNYSGFGYAGMLFDVNAVKEDEFPKWVEQSKASANELTLEGYNELRKQSRHNPQVVYSSAPADLFETILLQYVDPKAEKIFDSNAPDPKSYGKIEGH